MSYKRNLVFLGFLIFLACALTFYLNLVIFPPLIKKFAVGQLEAVLKRRVVIEGIRFNWFKGFVIDHIKIYERKPPRVFAQADEVSFGLVIIPGFKHYQIVIPFIRVHSPLLHLIRESEDVWNFSDLKDSYPAKIQGPSGAKISLGGVTVTDGACLVEDTSSRRLWSELFNHINLNFSLFPKAVNYKLSADIPKRNGSIKTAVNWEPVSQNVHAHIELKNIDAASYLSLLKIPETQLTSGMIEALDIQLDSERQKISASGDALITGLNVRYDDQIFKGTAAIHGLDAQYDNGNIKGRGQIDLSPASASLPGVSAKGRLQIKVDDFRLTPKQGIQVMADMKAQEILLNGPQEALRASLLAKGLSIKIQDNDRFLITGNLQADNVSGKLADKTFSSPRMNLNDFKLTLNPAPQTTDTSTPAITARGRLDIDRMHLVLGEKLDVSGSFKADQILFNLTNDLLGLALKLTTSQGHFVLNEEKILDANPRLEITLQIPLKNLSQTTYQGSLDLSEAVIQGLEGLPTLHNIALDADFKTDTATINAFSAEVFNTNVQAHGTVTDFKNPALDINALVNEFNLSSIKNIAPSFLERYGLEVDGTSSFKIKFNGLLSHPMDGHFQVMASLSHARITSALGRQKITDINGNLQATQDSLSWHDVTATFLGTPYTTTGSMDHFKNPHIMASLAGGNLRLKADMTKNDDRVTVHHVTGSLFSMGFDSKGSVTLGEGHEPQFDLVNHAFVNLQDFIKALPQIQQKNLKILHPSGDVTINADVKGVGGHWKNYTLRAELSTSNLSLMGYRLNDIKIYIHQQDGKVKNLTLDGRLYGGLLRAVGSMDLMKANGPYEMALNVEGVDLHQLKMDSPFRMEEINGKYYMTAVAHGTMTDCKNKLEAQGSVAIREGYLGQFNFFQGLLGVLNEALRLGQIMITDVDGNFTIASQKIHTENLRLKGPTLVLLGKGWVDFNQNCDLDMTIDLSSGVIPPLANDMLQTLDIRIYDKISHPKFKRKISMPQIINTLLKNFL